MSNNRRFLTALLVAGSTLTALGAPQPPRSVPERAKSSQHVVVATIVAADARYEANEFGDHLIVSKVRLAIEETLKGPSARELAMDLEGGTVGDVTLAVSDLPKLERGERAVFFLAKSRTTGRLVPHLRGQSILKLDKAQRVTGTDVTLAEVREQVRNAR
jgi:hypothetical protein